MNILVCIKPDKNGEGIGPFEALALEAGLCLKETIKGQARVDVITLGPSPWSGGIRRALGMGADSGIHILAPEGDLGLVPASVTASLLARAISSQAISYDLILTGVMSQAFMAGQTGPMLAEYLGLALATAVVRVSMADQGLKAVREWEGGVSETLCLPLPALVSIQAGVYTPRYPSLSHMLGATEKPVTPLSYEDVDFSLSGASFLALSVPEQIRKGERVAGRLQDQVHAFKAFLRERALI